MRTPVLKNLAMALTCVSAWHTAGAADRNAQPLNLARPQAGAQLVVDGAKADPASTAALLRDDDPLGFPLAAGETSMTLTLPQVEVVKRFNFLNLTAAGKVTVAVSSSKAANAVWREVDSASFTGTDVVNCDFGSVEARHVKVTFQLDTPGRIDTFGLFGLKTVASAPSAHASSDKALLYNYAVSSPDAGVVMVSPGEDLQGARSLADGDVGTSFAFKATDPEPMAVVDLGTTRALNRVSMSFKSGPGHMAVYLLPDPQDKALNKTKARTVQEMIATDFPGAHEPVLATETGTQPGLNRISGNVNGQSGRYLVMDFKPAAGAVGEAKDFKDVDFKDTGARAQAPGTSEPLVVSELTAFGNVPPGTVVSNFPPVLPGTSVSGNPPPVTPPIFPPSGGSSTVSP